MEDVFALVDIGSTKIVAVIGKRNPYPNPPVVLGMGQATNTGIYRGAIFDGAILFDAIKSATEEAMISAEYEVEHVNVSMSFKGMSGLLSRGMALIREFCVSEHDMDQVMHIASITNIPSDRDIIHVLPLHYQVDHHQIMANPIGMSGKKLELSAWVSSVPSSSIDMITSILQRLGHGMGNCISQSFASAYAISQLEKSAAFVFDIGEGSTDMAIISSGHVRYVSSFFYAGMHLVNDLSAVLGLSSFDSRSLIVNGEIDVQSENEKSVIVRERMLEILNTCMEELHGAHFERDIRPCVYICGGVSKLTGVEKLVENTLKTKCVKPKINWPDGWLESFQDERYVSTLGAMLYFSRNAADGEKRRLSFSSIAQSIKDWLENNF